MKSTALYTWHDGNTLCDEVALIAEPVDENLTVGLALLKLATDTSANRVLVEQGNHTVEIVLAA